MNLTEYIDSQHDNHLNDLYEFLRIPSVSAQSEHKPDIERAAKWTADRLHTVGLDNVEIVPTKMHPLVYGESLKAPGKPTVLFYGHYDVQPAEPLNLWTSPAFEPTIRNGNLFGRGTADDKGQVHIHVRALDAILKTAGKLPINLKVMIEGEEEVGSVSLWDFVSSNKSRLKADALIVSDTSMFLRLRPWLAALAAFLAVCASWEAILLVPGFWAASMATKHPAHRRIALACTMAIAVALVSIVACYAIQNSEIFADAIHTWDPLESTCRHASLSIL